MSNNCIGPYYFYPGCRASIAGMLMWPGHLQALILECLKPRVNRPAAIHLIVRTRDELIDALIPKRWEADEEDREEFDRAMADLVELGLVRRYYRNLFAATAEGRQASLDLLFSGSFRESAERGNEPAFLSSGQAS